MEVEMPDAGAHAPMQPMGPWGGAPTSAAANNRLDMLRAIYTKCLQYGLREPSAKGMAAHFPGLPEPTVHALCDLYKQVLSHLEIHSMAEFNAICHEYCMDAKLDELEQLQQAAQSAASTTRSPASLTKAAEAEAWTKAKQQEVCELQNLLSEASKRRSQLQQAVVQRQSLIQEVISQYDKAVADVQQVYLASQGQDVQPTGAIASTPVR